MGVNPITGKRSQLSKSKREKKKTKPYVPREKTLVLPTTRRHCLGCGKTRIFKFNPVIGHSRCTTCDGSFSRGIDPCEAENMEMWGMTKEAKEVNMKEVNHNGK